MVVRYLRRRPVDPRRYSVRRHARPGGRRPPVDHHPLGRARAAPLRRLGAGVRPGPGMDAAPRAQPRGARGRHLGVLPPDDAPARPVAGGRPGPGDAPSASSAAARCSPAATRCDAATGRPSVVVAAVGAARAGGGGRRRRAGGGGHRLRRGLPDLAGPHLPRAPGPAGARRRRGLDPRRAVCGRADGADRHASSTATLTRSASSPPSAGRRSPVSASRTSASPATSTTCTATSASTRTPSSAPPSTSSSPEPDDGDHSAAAVGLDGGGDDRPVAEARGRPRRT